MNELHCTSIWASHTEDYSRGDHLLITAKFLNLNTISILGWMILFVEFCLCTVGCLAAFLAFTH